MQKDMGKENPYGKTGDVATKQIIDRIISQHFSATAENKPSKGRSIGEMQDEILREISKRSRVVDFTKENCEFK